MNLFTTIEFSYYVNLLSTLNFRIKNFLQVELIYHKILI